MESRYTVTIPADINRPDRVVANLTAVQLAILIPAGALVWLVYVAVGAIVPFPIFVAMAIPIMGAATALALVERDGTALHQLAWHAIKQATDPRRLVIAPQGVPALPAWTHSPDQDQWLPAPLRLPARAIRGDGAINLGPDGVAAVVACSTLSFALRTPEEQAGLVEGFGNWLNSLGGPAQIVVRAQPIDLAPAIAGLRDRAAALPHPALEEAAREHARFLAGLAATRDLFARRVLIVLREPHAAAATGIGVGGNRHDADATAMRVLRRAEQTSRALAAAGTNATVLGGGQASAVLAACADPTAPPMDQRGHAAPGEAITTPATAEPGGAR